MILDKKTRFVKENRPDRHYINNDDLLELLREYNRTKVVSNELCESFMLMAKNIAKERGFREKPYIDDCIQSGVMCCIKYVHNFDENESKNPFAYFTQCIKFAFVNVIKKENKLIDFKKKLLQYDSEGYLVGGEAFNGEDGILIHSTMRIMIIITNEGLFEVYHSQHKTPSIQVVDISGRNLE